MMGGRESRSWVVHVDAETHAIAKAFYKRRAMNLRAVVTRLLIVDMQRIERAERAATTRRAWDQ